MDELIRRYEEIRTVLARLVNTIPGEHDHSWPSHELRLARDYLHNHCEECGAALGCADYAQVHALEMVRVGPPGTPAFEDAPICPACYRLRCAVWDQFAVV